MDGPFIELEDVEANQLGRRSTSSRSHCCLGCVLLAVGSVMLTVTFTSASAPEYFLKVAIDGEHRGAGVSLAAASVSSHKTYHGGPRKTSSHKTDPHGPRKTGFFTWLYSQFLTIAATGGFATFLGYLYKAVYAYNNGFVVSGVERTFKKYQKQLLAVEAATLPEFRKKVQQNVFSQLKRNLMWPWSDFDNMFHDADVHADNQLDNAELIAFLDKIGWTEKHSRNFQKLVHGVNAMDKLAVKHWMLWKLVQEGRSTKRLLVLGEVGDGKSTLVNGLKDEDEREAAAGLQMHGITKEIKMYRGTVVNSVNWEIPIEIFDTPGVGDANVPVQRLVQMLEGQLRKWIPQSIDGVVCTLDSTKGRFTFGGQLTKLIIDKGFINNPDGQTQDRLWANVVVAGTKSDIASPDHKALFERAIPTLFAKKVKAVLVHHGQEGYAALKRAICELPNCQMAYTQIEASDLANLVCSHYDVTHGEALKMIQDERDKLAAKEKELLKKEQDIHIREVMLSGNVSAVLREKMRSMEQHITWHDTTANLYQNAVQEISRNWVKFFTSASQLKRKDDAKVLLQHAKTTLLDDYNQLKDFRDKLNDSGMKDHGIVELICEAGDSLKSASDRLKKSTKK